METLCQDISFQRIAGFGSGMSASFAAPLDLTTATGMRTDDVQKSLLEVAQLLTRHWIIIDAEGNQEEVRGPGVVGQTPTLAPGEGFKYTSYCPLPTPWGTMEGSYRMQRPSGEVFDAKIARFYLRQS